jgi:hypothetical protein
MLHQALQIIFEVQKKRSNGKLTRRKINFPTYKTHFFGFFFSFWTPLIFKPYNFLIFIHFKLFKTL